MNRTRTSSLDAFGLRDQRNRIYPTMEGSDGSTLSLDFTTMSLLDSRFTFTRASTGTYINSAGLVTTMAAASTNDPTKARFDYDPTTLAPRGLLIEGSATNLIVRSEDFSSTSWTIRGNVTTTGNTSDVTDPAGGNTATKVVTASPGATAVYCSVAQPVTVQASTTYTMSFWIRGDAGNQCRVYGHTGGTPTELVAQANYTYSSTGWTRVQTQFATGTFTGIYVYVCSQNVLVGGTAKTFYIWGAQLEVTGSGTGPSSYIPTGSSTVQRAADSCSIALSSFGFNTEGGTFFADWYRKEYDVSSTGSGGPWNTDYASARWLGVQTTSASNAVFLGSWSGQTSISNGATRNKAAATYGSWGGSTVPITFCVNGSAVSSGTRDFNPANPTRLIIGAASSSSPYTTATRDFLNNSIRSIKYWPTVLPDATLQSLTQ